MPGVIVVLALVSLGHWESSNSLLCCTDFRGMDVDFPTFKGSSGSVVSEKQCSHESYNATTAVLYQ